MKSCRWIAVLLAAGWGASLFADVTTNSFDRYKVIIEKSPFKRFSDPNPTASQTSIGSLTLTGFFYESNLKKVFIRDTKANKTYYAGEGDSVLDYHVDKIDPENQSVVLTRGVETQSLKFPEKTTAAPQPTAAMPPLRPVYRAPVRPAQPVAAPVAPPAPATPAITSPTGSNAAPEPAAPTSLRRRILRHQLRPVQPAEGETSSEDTRDAEGQALQEKAAEKAAEEGGP